MERTPPERETPQGRPREPPAAERERQKGLAAGRLARQRRVAREGAARQGREERTLAQPLPRDGRARNKSRNKRGVPPRPSRGAGALPETPAAAGAVGIKERGKKPRGGFLGRDRTSARPNDSAHTDDVPQGRRRAVAVGYTRRRYRPQRGRLGGGQSTAAAVHEMSRTAQPLVQSLTGREPSQIINHGGSSASAGACQPVFLSAQCAVTPRPCAGFRVNFSLLYT